MNKSIKLAIAIAILASAWLLSGLIFPPQKDNSTALQTALPAQNSNTQVAVREISSVTVDRTRPVHGRIEAQRSVEIDARTAGVVEIVHVPRGSTVKQGDLLLSLKMDDREARLAQAKADVERTQLEYDAARKLGEKQFSSRINIAAKKSAHAQALAMFASAQLDIENANVRAPFDGVFNDHFVEVGDTVRVGDRMIHMLDLDPLRVVTFLSERIVDQVNPNRDVPIHLLSGTTLTGQLSFLSAAADPATRTYRLEASVANPTGALRSGMTVTVDVPTSTSDSHVIPLSTLTLSDGGMLGVKTVNDASRVVFNPVTVVQSDADQAWVTGLPETATLITVGHEFVPEGLLVETRPDNIFAGQTPISGGTPTSSIGG